MRNPGKHEAFKARSLCFSLFLMTAVSSFTHAEEMEVREVPLVNPGFELNVLHEGWSLHVYGAPPTLAKDTAVRHEGRQSLRVSAAEPSDTAFAQEMDLQAGRLYRLTGWVKTQNLDPKGSPVYGTFQIQHPGGQTTLMSGRNHGGDTDWTQESILFRAPPGGRARIALFFVGFGKGTGTVWFDDIRLEQVLFMPTHLRVRRDFIGDAEISPFQYGQFIEYLCDLVPGMWAERIYNASFEGVVPYNVAFRKETDFREKPWYPVGAVHRGSYALDEENPFNGKLSQRISVEGEPCTLGIAQDGLFVEGGKRYRLSLYLRQKGLQGWVRASLRGHGVVYPQVTYFYPKQEWQKYTARLVPSPGRGMGILPMVRRGRDARATGGTGNATLALEFRGPGTIWIDQVSLMPEDTVGGWRPDVVQALRELRPGIIRFGGSTTETFDWRNTIGDPDRRVPWRNAPWGGMHPTGAGLEEFVQLCRAVDAEPLICVRVSGKEPAEGAAQVEYFNGRPDTPMGRLRATNGHAEPYGVKYWQVGNELGGDEYARELAAFCAGMKAADPTIKLLSAFPSPAVLREAGEYLDYLCPHHYGCEDLAGKEAELQELRRLAAECAPGRKLKVAVTEWNTTAGDWGLGRAKLWTLDNALACSRYHNLMHRYADAVEIANRSNLTNSFCSGIIQTDNYRLYKTPTYYAQQLYACHAGSRPLQVEIEGDLERDDVSATLSRDGRTLVLFIVNNTWGERQIILDLSAFGPLEKTAQIWTLTDTQRAGERDVTNGFDNPERVHPVASSLSVQSAQFGYAFPALSLIVLEVGVSVQAPESRGTTQANSARSPSAANDSEGGQPADPLSVAGSDETAAGSETWLDRIRSNAVPFSFKYDGVPSGDLLPKWKCVRRKTDVGSNRTLLTTEWTDARSGLRVTYDLTLFDDFPAAEWVLFFENRGSAATPTIEDVQAMDMFLGGAKGQKRPFVLHRTNGAPSNPTDFEVSEVALEPGKVETLSAGGGRSSNRDFPFFRVDCGERAVIIAVGWSGQWKASLGNEEGPVGPRLRIRAGLEQTHFRLLPKERVRAPRMLVLFHEGDASSSNSQFRRLIYRHYAATYRGRKPDPILFCNTCFTRGGGWLNECNEENQISLMKALQPLGVEAVITDAGWFRGGWPSGAGNWDVDKTKYPRGMAPVAKAAKDLGMVYGLWFEPERVVEGTEIDRNHGDWVLRRKSGGGGGLLNFGLPEVQKYFFGIVEEYLKLPGFEVYRQDCNIDPLSFWRENDAPDRQGITEMHYIAGLYAYWDMIKARYPNTLMEECASGGRRIDLETIMRFHIHQKSDYWFDNVIDQASIYGMSQYLPNGLVSVPLNRLDDYSFHSTLASSLIPGWIADAEDFDMARAKTITDTYRKVRHVLNGDWYGLTGYNRDESKWLASQYHRADLDEGMVLAFRRKECREDTLRVQLKGLNPAATYEVHFTTTGRREEFTGEQLAKELDLKISQTPGSDLIIYRKTEPNASE